MGRLARTLARRRCARCTRDLGLALWPWSGRWFVTTHGLCDPCYALDEGDAGASCPRESTASPSATR
jgi:hypothetical protein